jgi:hypothetical protein
MEWGSSKSLSILSARRAAETPPDNCFNKT